MRTLLIAAAALLLAGAAFAQTYASPPPGSLERRAILDAMRPRVERQLGAPVEFVVREIRVGGGWAFVQADPQRPGGGAIENPIEEADGVHTEAILRKAGVRWVVQDLGVGSTDVWWLAWCDRVPAGLMQGCG